MRLIICIVSVLISSFVFTQTELIAYKSHSGNMAHYKLTGYDNLGGPPIYIDSILKLNDSTIVEYFSWGMQNDTIINHPVCNLSQSTLDSLKGNYYNLNINFIEFENKIITDTIQKDSVIKAIKTFGENESKKEDVNVIPTSNENITPPSNTIKEVNSTSKLYVLWYGLFGFVTMLIFMVWYNQKSKLQV